MYICMYPTCIAGGITCFMSGHQWEIEAVWEWPGLEKKEVIKLRSCRVPRPPMNCTLRGWQPTSYNFSQLKWQILPPVPFTHQWWAGAKIEMPYFCFALQACALLSISCRMNKLRVLLRRLTRSKESKIFCDNFKQFLSSGVNFAIVQATQVFFCLIPTQCCITSSISR